MNKAAVIFIKLDAILCLTRIFQWETFNWPVLMSYGSHCIIFNFPMFLIISNFLEYFLAHSIIFFFLYNDKKNGICLGCRCICTCA